jgi:hypothetical protein
MIAVQFLNCGEIRMGSPFQMCGLRLTGEWTPNLGEYGWQPLYARSPDGRYLALVEWDTAGNTPGFRLVRIDEKQKSFETSQRILGCCEALNWQDDAIFWKAFPGTQGIIEILFGKSKI